MSLIAPANFAEIASAYDVLLCDIWGVVHNGASAYPGVIEALSGFRARGGTVVLISNVPKPRDPIPGQLARLGIGDACYDAIVTSGDAIRAELKARAPGPFLKIGPADDGVLWDGLGLVETRAMQSATFVAISGLDDPLNEDPQDYRERLEIAAARGLALLCANPDKVVRIGKRLVWCAGAVAQVYADMGGKVIMAGKPYPPIYALAFQELERLGANVDRARVLCVGDGVGTDVLGANRQGLDCLFIASGVHGETLRRNDKLDLDAARATLEKEEAFARFVLPHLA